MERQTLGQLCGLPPIVRFWAAAAALLEPYV
jgi:hypothetical protein